MKRLLGICGKVGGLYRKAPRRMAGKNDEKKSAGEPCDAEFPIREFPDMRTLRETIRKAKLQAGPHAPEEHVEEEDFGLRRSTREEALEFLRDIIAFRDGEGDGDDPLTEFLDER